MKLLLLVLLPVIVCGYDSSFTGSLSQSPSLKSLLSSPGQRASYMPERKQVLDKVVNGLKLLGDFKGFITDEPLLSQKAKDWINKSLDYIQVRALRFLKWFWDGDFDSINVQQRLAHGLDNVNRNGPLGWFLESSNGFWAFQPILDFMNRILGEL